ncbi:MAG: hypothetical protein JWQ44_2632 [Chthoniobacter sp.]|nr:hypothetical protein [Chthoniobacter sp.]
MCSRRFSPARATSFGCMAGGLSSRPWLREFVLAMPLRFAFPRPHVEGRFRAMVRGALRIRSAAARATRLALDVPLRLAGVRAGGRGARLRRIRRTDLPERKRPAHLADAHTAGAAHRRAVAFAPALSPAVIEVERDHAERLDRGLTHGCGRKCGHRCRGNFRAGFDRRVLRSRGVPGAAIFPSASRGEKTQLPFDHRQALALP